MDPAVDLTAAAASTLVPRLRDLQITVASAESLTGGGVGAALTSVPGASEVYVGGVIAYAGSVKQSVLGVPETVVSRHGVVSAECAEAMAVNVRRLLDADLALATTGVAGPDGQEGKPVGLVYVAVAHPTGCVVEELHLSGDRAGVRSAAVRGALEAGAWVLHHRLETGTWPQSREE